MLLFLLQMPKYRYNTYVLYLYFFLFSAMFKSYIQDQDFLLPPSFSSFLGEWHEAVVLSEIIDSLNIRNILSSYKNEFKWTSAYHPIMLIKVLFYGYMNATFSSRRIASKLTSDLAYMFLSGNTQPDFRTINRFRKEKWDSLVPLFVQIVAKAQELGLISFGRVSIDGTKIYADASKHKNMDMETLEKKMKKLMEEAEKIDDLEDDELGEDNDGTGIPDELKTKEWRDKKRQEIEEKKKEIEARQKFVSDEIKKHKEDEISMKRINTTDTDSRMMQMKRKDFSNGYNPQIATENQIILASTVPNSAGDIQEFIPVLRKIEELHGKEKQPKQILADRGYASETNYEYLEQNWIDGYIPHPKLQWKLSGNLEGWKYDTRKDEYTDPDGNIYRFASHGKRRLKEGEANRKQWRPRKEDIIRDEDFRTKIYKTKVNDGKRKVLKISKDWLDYCKKQDEKLATPEWKEIYRTRCHDVEPVFGNIKRNLKFERFSLRWFHGVQIEWNLVTIAHNLKKIMGSMRNISA